MSTVGVITDLIFNKGAKHRVVATGVSVICFWVFLAWSLGLAPAFGSGFARAEDVKSIQSVLLENAIIEARIRYCAAPNGAPSKQFFLKATNKRLKEYYTLTQITYDLPLCEELVVAAN